MERTVRATAGASSQSSRQMRAQFWSDKLVESQRSVMIAAAATAVGINMTFLLPYSMLSRGWDKPFRGLARFDLCDWNGNPLRAGYQLCCDCGGRILSCSHR